MDKLTALSAAGALAMTSVAAVSALFLTIGQGATASSPDPAPAMPVVKLKNATMKGLRKNGMITNV